MYNTQKTYFTNIAPPSTYVFGQKKTSDYYPFGMQMPGRFKDYSSTTYRFAYNGMEYDKEAKNDQNSYTTEFRQYDPRLGRWLSLDPLMMRFPSMSPYCAFDNNPIYFTDPYGLSSVGPEGGEEGDPFGIEPDIQSESDDGKPRGNSVIATGDNTPGVGRDMGSGYKSDQEIKNDLGFQNGILNVRLKADDDKLFKELHGLGDDFADGEKAKKMIKDIIDHFKNGNGENYSSWDLTKAAADHPSTQRFINQIKENFQSQIKSSGGYKDDGTFVLKGLEGHPRFNNTAPLGIGSGDEDNGLRIAVNDVWDYDVKVVSYREIEGKYIAEVQLVLYDHFGLDRADIADNIYATVYPAFYSWYILQYQRGYKPFVTVMHIPSFTIKGSLPKK